MFDFFKKKDTGTPEERIAACCQKKDWAELARVYYQMGCAAMDAGDLNHAEVWLQRADTIFSARDEIYDAVGEKLMDGCSDRIGTLEDEPLLYNSFPQRVGELAETLSDGQVRVWGLLSMARLVTLGRRLAVLPGCEVLGELEWAVDMMLRSLQAPPTQEEDRRLSDLCDQFYELNGGPHYWCGEIEVPGGAPFQVFDLNGMFGVEQEINMYIDSHIQLLRGEDSGAENDMVGVTLLPDYYVRTTGTETPGEVPQIKAELARILADYDFVRSGITWAEVARRVEEYKRLDILQA